MREAAFTLDQLCFSCAERLCVYTRPIHGECFGTGTCSACGRPGLVAVPDSFGGLRQLDTERG